MVRIGLQGREEGRVAVRVRVRCEGGVAAPIRGLFEEQLNGLVRELIAAQVEAGEARETTQGLGEDLDGGGGEMIVGQHQRVRRATGPVVAQLD